MLSVILYPRDLHISSQKQALLKPGIKICRRFQWPWRKNEIIRASSTYLAMSVENRSQTVDIHV